MSATVSGVSAALRPVGLFPARLLRLAPPLHVLLNVATRTPPTQAYNTMATTEQRGYLMRMRPAPIVSLLQSQ